jgi:26S proteasome regulatory subunit N12
MEDEALDDEMDVLREMEMESSGQTIKPSPGVTKSATTALAGDGQFTPSSGAPNNTNDTEAIGGDDNEVDEKPALGRDGKQLKVWKKKGQKRTTRRVICKFFGPLCVL